MKDRIQLSVRYLVEYVYRSGSIETGLKSGNPLSEGTKAHQHLQRMYKDGDQKEVYLRTEFPFGNNVYCIDGRCDGVLFEEKAVIIEEIKSTTSAWDQLEEDRYPVHWAQAMVYGYMYSLEHHLEQIGVQLTYIHIDTHEVKKYRRTYQADQLYAFMEEVIARYAPFAEQQRVHQKVRNDSLRKLAFPFPAFREGQRRLAGAVYKTIADSRCLLAKAPTGIGKTISTIFPTMKAIGEGKVHRACYLTARTTTQTAAEEALSLLEQQGMRIHALTITAKDKICFKEETKCQADYCEYAEGYYDRINEGLLDLFTHETIMTRSVIEQYAYRHCLCPFELSLDAAYVSDVLICDYNYVYDPRISLNRMFEEMKKQSVLLIDEAHNLVDRARDIYSASLLKSRYVQLKREYKHNRILFKVVDQINKLLIAIRKQCDDRHAHVWITPPQELIALLEQFVPVAEQELVSEPSGVTSERHALLLEAYFEAQDFLRSYQWYDERFMTYAEVEQSEVRIKLLCLDPSYLLGKMGKGYRSKIFFSATLSPLTYFRSMLSTSEDDYTLSIPTPYKSDQWDMRLVPLSTRYKDRDRTKAAIIDMLMKLIQEKPGNYLVFFPSYTYLKDIYASFIERQGQMEANETGEFETIVQAASMSEEERDQFLTAFTANRKSSLIGFAVLGGIFSEGIDLAGDRLNRVVIIGVGLPQIGLERDLMKNYYNQYGVNGYHYAYVFPGMNKVLQAGGRLIRSERDKGMLVLVDDRYMTPLYNSLLPDEWKDRLFAARVVHDHRSC